MSIFKKTFEITEIHEDGSQLTHQLKGSKRSIKKDIKMYKDISKNYLMIGTDGMIVWA